MGKSWAEQQNALGGHFYELFNNSATFLGG
jgi:hypothetical protein